MQSEIRKIKQKKGDKTHFSVLDLVVFIATTALALAGTRHRWADFYELFGPGGTAYKEAFPTFMYQARILLFYTSLFTSIWSLTCLILGLRRSARTLRLALRQPGMVACLTAVIVLGFRTAGFAVTFILKHIYFPNIDYLDIEIFEGVLAIMEEIRQIPSEIGCAVAAAWVVQWASGRWRPEPRWPDRTGRILGLYWIANIPFGSFSWST